MPWKAGHKEETRERILSAAANAFRAHGVDNVGVAEVMEQAGLTHGGFYAHFKSKDELVTAALQFAMEHSATRRFAHPESGDPPGLLAIAKQYLRPDHVQRRANGCAIAALSTELGRAESPAKPEMAAAIDGLRKLLLERAPGGSRGEREVQAAGTLAAMVGGIILARGMEGGEDAERFLANVKRFLGEAIGEDAPAAKPS